MRASRKSPSNRVQGLICSEQSWQPCSAPQHASCCSSGGATLGGVQGPAAEKKSQTQPNPPTLHEVKVVCVHLCEFALFSFFFSTATRLSISSEDSCLYLYQEIIPIISSITWAAVQGAACCYPSLLSGVWDSWAARLERWGSFRALGCTRRREIILCAANLSLQERWFSPL